MSPGLVERDGETRIRISKGLELTIPRALALVGGILFLFVIPELTLLSTSIQLSVIHQGLMFGLAAVGLNLLLRHTKLVSFGHAAFFGTGAYTAALLAQYLDVTGMFVLLFGAVVGATIMAAIIGALSLRHTGLYFALLTLAFGQLLYAIALGQDRLLGGSDGMPVRPGTANQPLIFGEAFGAQAYRVLTYYITVVILLVALLVMWRIVQSPFRNALDAVGQDRTRAQFIGLPVKRYVWVAFVISGTYGGIGGGLYAIVRQYVRPEGTLYFLRSGDILFMAILGGFETLVGPLVGGVVLIFLEDIGRDITAYFEFLTGVVLLVLVFGFPEGIVGSLQPGGVVREGAAEFRDDPSVAVHWIRRASEVTTTKASRSIGNLRLLISGVE